MYNLFRKWVSPVVILILGAALVLISLRNEQKHEMAFDLYRAAQGAFEEGNYKGAYSMYMQSSSEFEDPHFKALALYEAATVGWANNLADYKTIVELYKQSLRFEPGFEEASFNLELLYWLKDNKPEELPDPGKNGDQPADAEVSNGDI